MADDPGYAINFLWIFVSAINFVVLAMLLYGALRLVRWARALGRRDREIDELSARVARLERAADSRPRSEDRTSAS